MRALALTLALAVTLAVAFLTYQAAVGLGRRRELRLARQARWQARQYSRDDTMIVAVTLMPPDGRVLDEHVVDRIPEGDPQWTNRLLLAMEEAEERAVHLNRGRALPG